MGHSLARETLRRTGGSAWGVNLCDSPLYTPQTTSTSGRNTIGPQTPSLVSGTTFVWPGT
jgi:hypothetical protein